MNQPNAEALLAQIFPVLANPKAFQSFIDNAPLTQEEKDTLKQIYAQFSNPQSTEKSIQAVNQVMQNLLSRSTPEQIKNIAPLLEQVSKMPPENLLALKKLLGF